MRRPCNADLIEAAAKLLAMDDPTGNAYRVGRWLDDYGREATDRQRAREAGCTVRYLRRVIDAEKASS